MPMYMCVCVCFCCEGDGINRASSVPTCDESFDIVQECEGLESSYPECLASKSKFVHVYMYAFGSDMLWECLLLA